MIGILNVLKSEKEHPEPRRAVVKFWRSVCSNTFIEFNRILDQIIRLVEIALNDYDWEVKVMIVEMRMLLISSCSHQLPSRRSC